MLQGSHFIFRKKQLFSAFCLSPDVLGISLETILAGDTGVFYTLHAFNCIYNPYLQPSSQKKFMKKFDKPFERVFDRVRVVLEWSSQRQRLQCIEQTPLQFQLVFWFSHERNCNFLVTIIACELEIIIIKNIYVFYGHILGTNRASVHID